MLARPHGQVPSLHFPNVVSSVIKPVQTKHGIELDLRSISQDLVQNGIPILSVNCLQLLTFLNSYVATTAQIHLYKITWGLVRKKFCS